MEETTIRKVSYSQYKIWKTCRWQWKLQYHDNLKEKENSIHMTFGTAVHETIQEYLSRHFRDTEEAVLSWDMVAYFKERLMETFKKDTIITEDKTVIYPCDKKTLKEFYNDGLDIIEYIRERINTFFPNKGFELVGCEIPLEVMMNESVKFVGYMDIVIKDTSTNEIYVYDLKTSGRGWIYEKKDDKYLNQLLLYKRYYSEQFSLSEDKIFVSFIILKRKVKKNPVWESDKIRIEKFDPSQGPISVRNAANDLKLFVESTFAADGSVILDKIKPTPSEKTCKYCPFKDKADLCSESFYLNK
jgi:hypothetical protein